RGGPRRGRRARARARQARGEDPGMSAIVTGAGRGIGKAVADRLAADGHAVVRVDLNPGDDILVADVTSAEERARILEAAGAVDVLVNNAGITQDARIVKM